MCSVLNMSIDKKRYDYSTLPKSWGREDLSRKPSMSTKLDMGFYNPDMLQKYDPKPQSFIRGSINPGLIPDSIDLTVHDYSTTGKNASSSSAQNQNISRSRTSSSKKSSRSNPYDYRGIRSDASLVPPIRQTASIFKQPVTLYKMQESKVKTDFKHGSQEKPKQLFWEKRLEGLKATDMFGDEIKSMVLPKSFVRSVGPNISDETILQSMATALHVLTQPLTGQLGNKTSLEKNPGVFLNPEQPLVQAITLCEDDIKRQEERVTLARKKLEEAMKSFLG